MNILPSPPLDFGETLCFVGLRRVRRPIASAKQCSAKSLGIFDNSTPRNRSRTTKIVHRGGRDFTEPHFSAESPMDFATSQARNSPRTIKIVGPESPIVDQKRCKKVDQKRLQWVKVDTIRMFKLAGRPLRMNHVQELLPRGSLLQWPSAISALQRSTPS